MTQLVYLRRRLKDATAAYEAASAERERFAKANWLSRTAWERLGYAVRDSETSDIVLEFPTPRGTESYIAYHASQVELRPGVWRKMVRHCPSISVDLNRQHRRHRAKIHAALLSAGEDGLAGRLLPSLVSPQKLDEDRAHLDWLDRQIDWAEESLAAARRAYEEVWLPVLQRRQETRRRRDLLDELGELGVQVEGLPPELSLAELDDLRRRRRVEVQRQSDLNELTRFGVDVSTLSPDLSSEALRRLVERRRRHTDPLRVSRVLRMTGIDPASLPDGVTAQEVIDLVEGNGYLATVPADLSRDDRLADLRRRGKVLAAWACESYPSYVREEACFHTPGRVKLVFRKPTSAGQPTHRPRRRSCSPDRGRLPAILPWRVVGF